MAARHTAELISDMEQATLAYCKAQTDIKTIQLTRVCVLRQKPNIFRKKGLFLNAKETQVL